MSRLVFLCIISPARKLIRTNCMRQDQNWCISYKINRISPRLHRLSVILRQTTHSACWILETSYYRDWQIRWITSQIKCEQRQALMIYVAFRRKKSTFQCSRQLYNNVWALLNLSLSNSLLKDCLTSARLRLRIETSSWRMIMLNSN